jgi:hypothetical protein
MTTPFTNADTRERLNVVNRREGDIEDCDSGRRDCDSVIRDDMNSDLRFTNRVQSGFLGNWGELDGQAAGNSARVADDPAAAANRLHASRTAPVDGGHLLLEPRAEGPHIRSLSPLRWANERVTTARRQG